MPGTVPNGSPIDTSTPGTGVFEVTAVDNAGNDTHLIRHYIVGGPGPTVAIYSPGAGAEYAVGHVVAADYTCSPAPGGARGRNVRRVGSWLVTRSARPSASTS